MALSQSAQSELLDAFRNGDGVDMIRESVRTILHELVEFERAGVIGAERYERTEDRVTERNGTRFKLLATNINNAPYQYSAAAAMVQALEGTADITRQGLMDALGDLSDGDFGMLLPGIVVDGTSENSPSVAEVQVQHFENGGWAAVGS